MKKVFKTEDIQRFVIDHMAVFDKEFWENKGYILRGCSSTKEWVNDEEYNLHINVNVQKITSVDKIVCDLIIK